MNYPGFGVAQYISGPPTLFDPIADRQASGDAQIDIAWTGDHAAVFIDIFNVRPSIDISKLRLRTSSDGGSTFDNGATDYNFRINGFFASQTTAFGQAAAIDLTSGGVGSDPNENCQLSLILLHPFDTTDLTQIIGHGGMTGSTPNPATLQLFGRREAAGRVDAVRFFFESGAIAEGRFTATGLRRG